MCSLIYIYACELLYFDISRIIKNIRPLLSGTKGIELVDFSENVYTTP